MLAPLVKRWFLLLLIAGCAVAWFAPGALAWTQFVPLRLAMSLSLFLVAWTLEGRRLVQAIRRPRAALWGVFIGYTVTPLFAWGPGYFLPPDFQLNFLICPPAP